MIAANCTVRHAGTSWYQLFPEAEKDLAEGEIVRVGGTWGFALDPARKGETFPLIIRADLIEMDLTAGLRPAKIGHIVYVDTAVDPPVLRCSGGATNIGREHVGIVHETPAGGATRLPVVWGGPL